MQVSSKFCKLSYADIRNLFLLQTFSTKPVIFNGKEMAEKQKQGLVQYNCQQKLNAIILDCNLFLVFKYFLTQSDGSPFNIFAY